MEETFQPYFEYVLSSFFIHAKMGGNQCTNGIIGIAWFASISACEEK